MKDKKKHDSSQVSVSTEIPTCRHIWIIEPPKGKFSKCTCKECNKVYWVEPFKDPNKG